MRRAVLLAVALAGGILLGRGVCGVGVLVLLIGLVLALRHWLREQRRGAVAIIWLLAGLGAGAACSLVYAEYAASHREMREPGGSETDKLLAYVAEVESFPEAGSSGWRAVIRLAVSGRRAMALFGPNNPRLLPGDRFTLVGRSRVVEEPLNLYEFDYGAFLLARRIGRVVHVDMFALAAARGLSPAERALRSFGRVRMALQEIIDGADIPSDNAGILRAILLGEQGAVPGHLRERYSEVGAAHILAVSGMHLAIFFLGMYGLLGFLLRPLAGLLPGGGALKVRLCAATLAGAGYMTLTGGPTSCVRAFIMVFGYALARVLGRDYDLWSWLGVSSLAILSYRPSAVTEAGFQLSTLSVAAIALAASCAARTPRLQRLRANLNTAHRFLRPPAQYMIGGMIASLAASLATLPFVWWHFYTVPLASLPANLIAVPLVTFWVLPAGLGAVAMSWAPAVATAGLKIANAGLFLLDSALETWGEAVSACRPPWPGWGVAAALCASLYAAAFVPRRNVRIVALMVATSCVIFVAAPRPAGKDTIIHFFASGEGDAALLRTPCGQTALIDGGRRELGRRALLPYLAKEGLLSLDLLVITHGHSDHWGGIAEIADKLEIARIVVNGSPSSRYAAEIIAARSGGNQRPPIVSARAGQSLLLCGFPMRVLWPADAWRAGQDENDCSLVLGYEVEGAGFLFTGDVEAAATVEMAGQWWRRTRARGLAQGRASPLIMKAPHHGHHSAAYERLLSDLNPDAVVVSSDGKKSWWGWLPGLPPRAPQALHVAVTGQDGAITAHINAKGQVFFDRLRRNSLE